MTDAERLDFLDGVIRAGLPFGVKPDYTALVGTVLIKKGSRNIREVIDTMKEINDRGEAVCPECGGAKDAPQIIETKGFYQLKCQCSFHLAGDA